MAASATDRPYVMRRSLSNLVAALSLLLCATVIALWVRSYSHRDWVYFLRPPPTGVRPGWETLELVSDGGVISFARQVVADAPKERFELGDWGWHWTEDEYTSWPPEVTLMMRLRPRYQKGPPVSSWLVAAPHWVVVLLFVGLPATKALAALRRRSRARGDRCVPCGYDLRASPQRCPECGAARTTAPETAA